MPPHLSSVESVLKHNAKASKLLGVINAVIMYKYLDILLCLRHLYQSLVMPHLEFSTPAWNPRYNQLLERIQHRVTRMIPGFKDLSYTDRLWKLGLWSLEATRFRSDLFEVYRMINELSKVKLDCFFEFLSMNVLVDIAKLKKRRFSTELLFLRVINSWSSLDLLSAPTLDCFKNGLQLFMDKDILPMDLL